MIFGILCKHSFAFLNYQRIGIALKGSKLGGDAVTRDARVQFVPLWMQY